jgi:DNA-binding transcriptional ArsR family regulator
MVDHQDARQDARLDAVFRALSDGTRRRMLRSLSQGERTVGELADPFDMSLAAASKHVKALERAGLVQREIRGRVHLCRLDAEPLSTASGWLKEYEQFWSSSLDRLEALLRREQAGGENPPAARRPSGRANPPSTRTRRPSKGKPQ